MGKHSLLFIGAVPPPYHGIAVSNQGLLNSKISDVYKVFHLDISVKRNLDNPGKVDFQNIYLALKNLLDLMRLCMRRKPNLVYVWIAPNIAYLRDGMFIVIAKKDYGCKA